MPSSTPPTSACAAAAGSTARSTVRPGRSSWRSASRIGGCPTGEARITRGYDLPARHVIHTVGPVWQGGGQGEPALLAACYRAALELAVANGVRTIAFPGISTGVYGYPLEAATRTAIATVRACLAEMPSIEQVRLVTFGDQATAMAERLLAEIDAA